MTESLIHKFQIDGKGIISIIGAGGKTSLMFRLAKEFSQFKKQVLTTTTTKIFMPDTLQSSDTIVEKNIDKLIQKAKINLKKFHHFSAGSKFDSLSNKLNGFTPEMVTQLWQAKLFDWIVVEADGAKHKSIKASDLHEPVIPRDTSHLILVTGLDCVGKTLDDTNVHRAKLFSRNTGVEMGETLDERVVAKSIAIEIEKAKLLCSPKFTSLFLNKADSKARKESGQKIKNFLKTNQMIDKIIIASLHE